MINPLYADSIDSSPDQLLNWMFATCRYMNGAATNPDSHVLAYAGAQVKKGLDVAKKLGAENFGTQIIERGD